MRWLLVLILCIYAEAKIKVAVSIAPQAYFIHQIAKDLVDVYVMVPNNQNPEQYEPLISQMKELKDSALYFGIGLDFEERWKKRFLDSAKQMRFIPPSKIYDASHDTHHDHHRHDNHIWLSVEFAKEYAQYIAQILSIQDAERSQEYAHNLSNFLIKIDELDSLLHGIFSHPEAKKVFLVFHPAFEYLAKEYGLLELAIEADNKEVKIRHMQEISQQIKKFNLKVIYKQPQFSDRAVHLLAKEYGLKISELDPFAYDWVENLMQMAKKIANEY